MSKVTVKISDKGVIKTGRALFGRKAASVTVGVFGDKGAQPASTASDEGEGQASLTIAQLAEIHEFGLGVPERSFIRSFFDGREAEIGAMLNALMKQLLNKAIKTGKAISDGDKRKVLEKIGLYCVGQIQGRMANGDITPALSQRTIDRKGSSVPLIDTGQLRSSITHEVEIKD